LCFAGAGAFYPLSHEIFQLSLKEIAAGSDLRLSPADSALVQKARKSGAPVITVLLSGRPLVLDQALDASDAFVAAWLPGTEGQGITNVLFSDYKPSGKLPRSWPASNEQISSAATVAQSGKPLFPRGFGLSYQANAHGQVVGKTE